VSFSRHGQIYRSDVIPVQTGGEVVPGSAAGVIVPMSLRPAIPWQVALQQSLPPLYQPVPFSTDWLNL
jgi:hypothetical protein